VDLKSQGRPRVYRKSIDMHKLTFKGLFKVSATKVLTCPISTCIISKNLLQYPERLLGPHF